MRKHSLTTINLLLAISLIIPSVISELDMDMDDSDPVNMDGIKAGPKTFHWLLSVLFLFLIPSVSAVLSFANRHGSSTTLQVVSAIYATIELMILRFPDMEDHENKVSRGTAWFLAFLLIFTVFVGSLTNSSKDMLLDEEFKTKWIATIGSRILLLVHRIVSVMVVLTGWVKVCLAPVALLGFCYDAHTGQCLAHGIMGSSFIAYGFYYAVILVVPWIRNGTGTSQSPEMFDSIVITVWGFVNTWTEHRWGRESWSMGDYQHTSMGIIWWSMGLLGIYLSRGGRRTFIPALVLMFTGYSMSEHSQHLEISTKVHGMFGLLLITAGVTRIIEIAFLLKDERSFPGKILSFQYLPSFGLIESGILFMGATEEQLILVKRLGSDHSAYILVLTSAASLIYLWFLLLIELYLRLVGANELGIDERGEYRAVHNEFELDDLSDIEDGGLTTPSGV